MDELQYVMGIVWTVAAFAAIVLCLAIPPKIIKKLLGPLAVITVVGALIFYGYGYSFGAGKEEGYELTLVPAVRAAFAAGKVFFGGNCWGDVSAAYRGRYGLQILFWLIHLTGMFTTAGTLITSLGAKLLRKMRTFIFRNRDLVIIYGLTTDTLAFGQGILDQDKVFVLYVDPSPDSALVSAADHMGSVVRADAHAVAGDRKFLRNLGMKRGKRKLQLCALSENMVANQQYAAKLCDALHASGISAERTSLTLLGQHEDLKSKFQHGEHNGYGSVLCYDLPELAARVLMRNYPPCDTVAFDETGAATQDFHCLVVGFGRMGQEVLRQLVMNGQFQGSRFRADVFTLGHTRKMGSFAYKCSGMLRHYDITFHDNDGRSREMFDYLVANRASLRYVAVCTGSSVTNAEIAEQLRAFLKQIGCAAEVYMCSKAGIYGWKSDDNIVTHPIYDPQLLCTDRIDRRAMTLHHSYCSGGDLYANWRNCSYYDRMSSRAAADFYPAQLRAAGMTVEQALEEWKPVGKLLENLARTEHLRWIAFQYAMGWKTMTETVFRERAARYLEEKQRNPHTKYRINKDEQRQLHACLVSWEALETYSKKEAEVTGNYKDYQDLDLGNVLSLNQVLRAERDNA